MFVVLSKTEARQKERERERDRQTERQRMCVHQYNNSAIVLIFILGLFSFWRLALRSWYFWTIFILAKCSAKKPWSWQPMAARPLVQKQSVIDTNLLRVFPFIYLFFKQKPIWPLLFVFSPFIFSKKNRAALSFSWFFVHFLLIVLFWGCLLGGVYVPCINRMPGGVIVRMSPWWSLRTLY